MTMTNQETIEILRARLSFLNGQMATAVALGDMERITTLQVEVGQVEASIAALVALE